jgi:bifunctional non-homologous end joining protein LigD
VHDHHARIPEITPALPEMVGKRRVILDGQIVALDVSGVPTFSRLQRQWPQNRRPDRELLRRVPVKYLAFCVFAVNDRLGSAHAD